MKKRKARQVWVHDWPHVCTNYRENGSFISTFCYFCNNGADKPTSFREVLPRHKSRVASGKGAK
jgi:hypothetical protein